MENKYGCGRFLEILVRTRECYVCMFEKMGRNVSKCLTRFIVEDPFDGWQKNFLLCIRYYITLIDKKFHNGLTFVRKTFVYIIPDIKICY